MAIFLVERNVLEGDVDRIARDVQELVSAEILHLKTYITPTKLYSLFDAPNAEQLRRLCHQRHFPIHRIAAVQPDSIIS